MPVSVDDPEAFVAKHFIDDGIPIKSFTSYSWKITEYSKQPKRVKSGSFTGGDYKWSMTLHPRQVEEGGNDRVSIYLQCQGPKQWPQGSHVCVQWAFAISNPRDGTCYIAEDIRYRFTDDQGYGFPEFAKLKDLTSPHGSRTKPLIENDETRVTAFVQVLEDETGVLWRDFVNWNSKKETGYVTLNREGATCHINPLLQSLFFTNYFRKAVYEIPTEHDGADSVASAIQRLFYQMQTSSESVVTGELTKSLRWKSLDDSPPHVVQDFLRVLQQKLQSQMKGTRADGAFQHLFAGRRIKNLKCTEVDYECSQEEIFYGIQLDVKNSDGRPLKTLAESLKAYVTPGTVEGKNKYHTGGKHGLQDAKKRTIFLEFPPVLHLHLKRFEYNLQTDKQVKINDPLEYPFQLDLAPYLDESSAAKADWNYRLHSVLLHSGDVQGGNYSALIKPHPELRWYKFDDDRVIPVTDRDVLKSGTDPSKNAYMLVYVRETEAAAILAPISETDIPKHLESRRKEEQEELEGKEREREKSDLYLSIEIVTVETFRAHQGFDLALSDDNTIPPPELPTFPVVKQKLYLEFKSTVARDLGYEPDQIRLWPLFEPENRPRTAVPENDRTLTMESVCGEMAPASHDLKFYLEVIDATRNEEPAEPGERQLMIFAKYFDVVDQTLAGIGHFYVKEYQRASEMIPVINSQMKFPAHTRLKLFEEIGPGKIQLVRPKTTFTDMEMRDGGIICFQIELSDKELDNLGRQRLYLDPVSFYDFLANRVMVRFKPRHDHMAKTDEFDLTLSKTLTYSQMAHRIGERLQHDPTQLRFTDSLQGDPKTVVSRRGTLADMIELLDDNSAQNILFYELLDLPIAEIEVERKVSITWTGAESLEEGRYSFWIPKSGSMHDVIDKLSQISTRAKFPKNSNQKIKLFTFHNGQIEKEFSGHELLTDVSDLENLYATVDNAMNAAQYDPVAIRKMLQFVTKLNVDGTNYEAWFRALGSILGMATGKVKILTSTDPTISGAEDLIIRQTIAASVDDALVSTVLEAESGVAAFAEIQKRYTSASRSEQVAIMKEIMQTRFKISDTTADIGCHFRAIKNLTGNLFKSGFELTKESLIGLFFHVSLPRLDALPFVNICRKIDARSRGVTGTISNDDLVRLARTELAQFHQHHIPALCEEGVQPITCSSSTSKCSNNKSRKSTEHHNCQTNNSNGSSK
ncbi:hypothetical protein MJO29_009439 [Puccinia striiformis f. sp. tritici]|nr:hypothetical protein Pst134EB_018403 [Puccinia striiformis f. sp. tritici]KAI7950765.1 hypothetical protein MJO29_009439 [Puccinia striiformis f. sp. tritici]